MEDILREILTELKKIREILEEQGKRNEKAIREQEAQKDKVKDLLKTINPQFADII